jgi:hypothetical protein
MAKCMGRALIALFIFLAANLARAQEEGQSEVSVFTAAEKGKVEKSKDAEAKMSSYLEIANDRLKALLSAAGKGDREGATQAVSGYREAVTMADTTFTQLQADNRNLKKNVKVMFKAVTQHVGVLLREIEKVPDDMRVPLQSALEAAQRVQNGVMIQMDKLDIVP